RFVHRRPAGHQQSLAPGPWTRSRRPHDTPCGAPRVATHDRDPRDLSPDRHIQLRSPTMTVPTAPVQTSTDHPANPVNPVTPVHPAHRRVTEGELGVPTTRISL